MHLHLVAYMASHLVNSYQHCLDAHHPVLVLAKLIVRRSRTIQGKLLILWVCLFSIIQSHSHVIKSLLQRIDFHKMIIDETYDEFYSYTNTHHTQYHQSYGPPMLNFVPPLPAPTQGPEIDGGYTYGPRTHYGETSSYGQSSSRDARVNYIFGPQRQGWGSFFLSKSNVFC